MGYQPPSTQLLAVSHATAVHSVNVQGVIKGEYNKQRFGKQAETLLPGRYFSLLLLYLLFLSSVL